MDLLVCPLQRNEGRPLPRRCHLQHDVIVNMQLWGKHAEKTFIPILNSGDGGRWKEREVDGWVTNRQRRRKSRPHGFFLNSLSAPESLCTRCYNLLLFWVYHDCGYCQTQHIPVCSHSLEENFTFNLVWMCEASQREWGNNTFGLTPGSASCKHKCTPTRTVHCIQLLLREFDNSLFIWLYTFSRWYIYFQRSQGRRTKHLPERFSMAYSNLKLVIIDLKIIGEIL